MKFVRYKILFTKRDREFAFPEQEELVADSLEASAFSAYKIAEFMQCLRERRILVPKKWGHEYPPASAAEEERPQCRDADILLNFPEEDKKYLRVYYEVIERPIK